MRRLGSLPAGRTTAGAPSRGGACQHALAQCFSGLEVGNMLGRDGHHRTRFRIAGKSRRTVVQCEAAEAAYLEAPPGCKRLGNRIEKQTHGQINVHDG